MGKNGSVLMLIGASVCGALISYAMFEGPHTLRRDAPAPPKATMKETVAPTCAQALVRVPGYKYVHHLLTAGAACESSRLSPLRDSVATLVEALRSQGQLTSATVHVRDFKHGEWMACNGNETYAPGALRDLLLLIAAFSMEERTPGFLDRSISGTSMRMFLHRMVAQHDAAARGTVYHAVPTERVSTLLAHLGLPASSMQDDHRCTAAEYTTIMASLFNAADLSPMNADKALDLLVADGSQRSIAALPADVQVAGVSAEARTTDGAGLNSTGIVYAPTGPYVVTIMAKGGDPTRLQSATKAIERMVYDRMLTRDTTNAGS